MCSSDLTFVEMFGLDHPDASLDAMERLTTLWSCEFAIRPFLIDHPDETFARRALELLGFTVDPMIEVDSFACIPETIVLGETIELVVALRSTGSERQVLVVDFVIHHIKANGNTSPKMFKWSTLTLDPGETAGLTKKHPVRPITTRRCYSGLHRVELQVAGSILADTGFVLDL